MKSEPIVITNNLGKVYASSNAPQVIALQEVNLVIERGDFVAVIGSSGSGKSTLLNLLGGIDKPTTGQLVVNGSDLSKVRGDKLADFRRQSIGLVFQLFNLVPVLSALENVKLPLRPYPPRNFNLDSRAQELLTNLGLAERMQHLPSQLSGGEQQRVAVARALINHPDLILADEPTGNLDSQTGCQLMEMFAMLNQQQGQTIIMVTHDPIIAAYAQRVVELRDGKLASSSVQR